MAEPASPIRFDQTRNTSFYMCRSCGNHVLSSENYRFEDRKLKVVICENAVICSVNVRDADVESRRLFMRFPAVEVFCNGCGRRIGHKFVMVEKPHRLVKEGLLMLTQNRMLYWNGNQVVYADTHKPVEDN